MGFYKSKISIFTIAIMLPNSYSGLALSMCMHPPKTEKDLFYEQQEEADDQIGANDIKTIIGDMNAKIRKEEIYQGHIGKQNIRDERIWQWVQNNT